MLSSLFFFRVTDTDERVGYLINMHSSELIQDEDKRLLACVDYFFIQVCCFFIKEISAALLESNEVGQKNSLKPSKDFNFKIK